MTYILMKIIQKVLFIFVPEETRYRLTQGSRDGCFTIAKVLVEPIIVFAIIISLSIVCAFC